MADWTKKLEALAEESNLELKLKALKGLKSVPIAQIVDEVDEVFRKSDRILILWPQLLSVLCLPASSAQWAEKDELIFQLIQKVFQRLIDTKTIPNVRARRVMECFLPHLESLGTTQLVDLVRMATEALQMEPERWSTRWFGVLSQILGVFPARSRVNVEDVATDAMSGPKYRSHLVHSICGFTWPSCHVTALCSIFLDLALSPDEFHAIQDCLCELIPDLAPAEIPALVHQMMRLSQDHASEKLLAALSHYFRIRLEKDTSPLDSEDLIEGDPEIGAVKQAEGTVLYHITSSIRRGHPMGKDIIKALRTGTQLPDVMLSPFTVYLALSLTSIKSMSQPILEHLKMTISKNISFGLRRNEDAWFRKATQSTHSTSVMFHRLLDQTSTYGGWELIEKGCLDLALTILDSSPGLGKPDKKLKALWALGDDMLCRMIKTFPHTVEVVIKMICKRILGSRQAYQYTDCLQKLVHGAGWSLVDNPMLVNDLLEQTSNLGLSGARRVLNALLPLVKSSRVLKNTTILMLRKALFARSVEVKQIGLNGVLQLIKSFKISSSLPVTQMSQSSSGLSQISVDVHRGGTPTNEALCLELLGVLRRGLSQHASVRLSLYQGLGDVLSRNPQLSANILEILSQHPIMMGVLSQNESNHGGDDVALLDLNSVIKEEQNSSTIQDPVGWYLHCVQQMITKIEVVYGEDTENLDDNGLKDKITDFLNDLAGKYSNSDLTDLNFVKDADYSRQTLAGETNANKIEILKNVIEALMEFTITHGGDVQSDKASLLLRLFRRHQELSNLIKNTAMKAPVSKKKMDNSLLKQGANKKVVKHQVGGSSKAFKNPEHAFSFNALCIILKACLIDQVPAHQSALTLLRDDTYFVRYLLRVLNEKQSSLERTLSARGEEENNLSDVIFKHLSSIGKMFVNNCLFNDESDENLSLSSLECLLRNLQIVTKYYEPKLKMYLTQLGLPGRSSGEILDKLMDGVFAQITSVQDLVDKHDQDEDAAKVIGHLFQIAQVLLHQYPAHMNSNLDDGLKKVSDWTRKYGESSATTDPNVLKPFLNLLFDANRVFKPNSGLHLDIAREIHSKLGDLNETLQTDDERSFAFISKESGETVLQVLIGSVESALESADIVISRSKQLISSESWNPRMNEDQIADCEKMLCQILARSINTFLELSQSGLKLGALLDQLLKSLIKLYTTLDNLAKYFFMRCKVDKDVIVVSKFDKVVEISKNVTKHLYEVINHIEKKARDVADDNASKKKGDSATRNVINKEARTIPNLIFKIEQFENDLIKIGSRCKIDFKLKASVSRDFRMDQDKLRQDVNDDSTMSDGDESSHHLAESTRIQESQHQGSQSTNSSTQASILKGGNIEPPNKKLKVKMSFRAHD